MRPILIALMLMTSTAHAETWLEVADLDKGGRLMLDTSNIDRGSDVRTAAFKAVYESDRPIAQGYRDVPADAHFYRWESNVGHFNCATRKVAVSQSILHDAEDRIVGRVDLDSTTPEFRDVPPASFGGILLRAVCAASAAEAGVAKVTSPANPDDFYPSRSRRRGEEGSPVVKVCVGPTGAVLREPEITDSSGSPDLDGAAIKVAKATRYAAAIQDGVAMPESCIRFKVKFARFPR